MPEAREALKLHKSAIVALPEAGRAIGIPKRGGYPHLRPLPLVSGLPLDLLPRPEGLARPLVG